MMKPMMACGHRANASVTDHASGYSGPGCAICAGRLEAVTVAGEPDLAGRIAQCSCGRTQLSAAGGLAFFEYRGPGSEAAELHCVCGFHAICHADRPENADFEHPERSVRDHAFTARGDRQDLYYCGCRGWD